MTKKTDNTEIAVISTKIGFIQTDIGDIKTNIKNLANAYSTKEELAVVAKATEIRLTRLENASNLWRWMSPTLSAGFAIILAFLVTQYLEHLH